MTMRLRPVEWRRAVCSRAKPGEEHYNRSASSTAATRHPARLALGCAVHDSAGRRRLTPRWARGNTCGPISRDTVGCCEASVLYRGRKQATSEATLTAAESGKLLASGTATA